WQRLFDGKGTLGGVPVIATIRRPQFRDVFAEIQDELNRPRFSALMIVYVHIGFELEAIIAKGEIQQSPMGMLHPSLSDADGMICPVFPAQSVRLIVLPQSL